MEGYLRGYYGYKNFGDELLFFGVVKHLFTKYPLTKLFVEVGDKDWMEDWIRENYQGLLTDKQLNTLRCINAKQHIHKRITHGINFLGFGKYRKLFKFFGGGEVLSDERSFPHDGRNLPLLFNASIQSGRFALLGGIGKPRKKRTEKLYKYLLPKAENIIVRDKNSYEIAKQLNPHNTVLYQDFAQEILQHPTVKMQNTKGKYILININKQMVNQTNIKKILDFCKQYPGHKKIFFPCDRYDDYYCFDDIKKNIPDLEMYDWTKYSLQEALSLFFYADGGVGARLHFLLPLKLYNKPIVPIPYAKKINALIINK